MSHDSKRKTPHAHAMRAAAVTDVVDAPAAAPVHNESARTTAEQQEGLAALAGTDAAPLRDAALDDWMAWGRELARGAGLIYAVDPIVQPDVPAVGRAGRPSGGRLYWYRHLGLEDGSYRWQGPKPVATGWGELLHVFSGGDGVIYAVDPIVEGSVPMIGRTPPRTGGHLYWYRHTGREDGSVRWEGPEVVGHGWGNFKHVFSGGDGNIYVVEPTVESSVPRVGRAAPPSGGRLLWYRHVGRNDGSFRWEGPEVVAHGWGQFKHVFSGGDGIIYAVEPTVESLVPAVGRAGPPSGGRLLWYRHVRRADGSSRLEGPKTVGDGWGGLERVFAGDGVIYAVDPVVEASVPMVGRAARSTGGHLYWYRHVGREDGSYRWQGPKRIGDGWGGLVHAFSGGDGSPAVSATLHSERLCDFLDPAGSPTVGIRAYGLKDGHKRGSRLTYSVSGAIPGSNLAQMVQAACNIWSAATTPAPGLPPALSLTLAGAGSGDIAVSVGHGCHAGRCLRAYVHYDIGRNPLISSQF